LQGASVLSAVDLRIPQLSLWLICKMQRELQKYTDKAHSMRFSHPSRGKRITMQLTVACIVIH
jgi:hypothetical protein